MNRKPSLALLAWYIPVLLVQLASASITLGGLDPWYRELQKPAWNAPNWLFGPVWTLLYLMMAISVWMISQADADARAKRNCYALFFVQLALNAAWSPLFFGMHAVGLAALVLLALVAMVALTAWRFALLRPLAAYLLVPYLIWGLYALSLNTAIWILN